MPFRDDERALPCLRASRRGEYALMRGRFYSFSAFSFRSVRMVLFGADKPRRHAQVEPLPHRRWSAGVEKLIPLIGARLLQRSGDNNVEKCRPVGLRRTITSSPSTGDKASVTASPLSLGLPRSIIFIHRQTKERTCRIFIAIPGTQLPPEIHADGRAPRYGDISGVLVITCQQSTAARRVCSLSFHDFMSHDAADTSPRTYSIARAGIDALVATPLASPQLDFIRHFAEHRWSGAPFILSPDNAAIPLIASWHTACVWRQVSSIGALLFQTALIYRRRSLVMFGRRDVIVSNARYTEEDFHDASDHMAVTQARHISPVE